MIAIFLATFNGEKYIREQIDSILAQTNHDWHLYIADDGSTDGTYAIIRAYAEKYPEKIFAEQNKLATKNARENFMQLACKVQYEEKYFMFCDQDDQWFPEKIEKALLAMEHAEAERGAEIPHLVHTDLRVVDDELNIIEDSFFRYSDLPLFVDFQPLLVQNNVTGCTTMINRALWQLLRQVKQIDIPKMIMHDYWIGLIAAAFGKITILNEPTMYYRQHINNQVGAKNMQGLKGFYLKNKNPKTMQRNLQAHYQQAKCFKQTYYSLLTEGKTAEALDDFLMMFNVPIIKRARLIQQNEFFGQRRIKRLIKKMCYLFFANAPAS